MTDAQAQRTFNQLRGRMARRYPVLAGVRLRLTDKHFLARPAARDLAWYEGGVVTVLRKALRGPKGRLEGLLAHELGHAADPDTSKPYAERRADAMAKAALGKPVRYDDADVQNLHHGVTPRPARLHENREPEMKRNPRKVKQMPAFDESGKQINVGDRIAVVEGRYEGYSGDVLRISDDGTVCEIPIGYQRIGVQSKHCLVRPKRNPKKGYKMPETQARHTAEGLLARMKADGADTFAKKVAWVKKHMPSIDRPRTFVGWVTKGERGRVVLSRNPRPLIQEANLYGDVGKYYRIEAIRGAGPQGQPKYALVIFNSSTGEYEPERIYPSIPLAIANMHLNAAHAAGIKGKDLPKMNLHKWFTEYEAKGMHANPRRNPTPAYHRSRGDAELMLAEDSYRKAQALRRRGDASGSHDALIHAHRMAALAEADLLDGASPRAADAKRLAWWKAYSGLAADKRRNPRRSR